MNTAYTFAYYFSQLPTYYCMICTTYIMFKQSRMQESCLMDFRIHVQYVILLKCCFFTSLQSENVTFAKCFKTLMRGRI